LGDYRRTHYGINIPLTSPPVKGRGFGATRAPGAKLRRCAAKTWAS
jgi:hypothetical protein